MNIKKIILFIVGVIWPLSLLLSNNPHDYFKFIIPAVLVTFSFWFYKKENKFFLYPLLAIPLVDLKLTILPLAVFIGFMAFKIKIDPGVKIIFLTTALIFLVINGRAFYQNSTFKLEYEAKQEILREIHLYPNALTARIYQNKARIVTDKISDNFFGLIDPGNYFFSFHPREGLLINQNLVKFPFFAIIPMLIGLLNISKMRNYKFIITILMTSVFSLSLTEIFDRSDFILWFPLLAVLIHGMNIINKSKNRIYLNLFLVFLAANSIIELIRILFLYKL